MAGVKILDLSRVLAVSLYLSFSRSTSNIFKGPFCTQILADYGADVIKVEHPKGGVSDTRVRFLVREFTRTQMHHD